MLNNIVYETFEKFAWEEIIPNEIAAMFHIGRKVDALELVISNHIFIDARDNGWYINDYDNPDCINWLQTTYPNYNIEANILQLSDTYNRQNQMCA